MGKDSSPLAHTVLHIVNLPLISNFFNSSLLQELRIDQYFYIKPQIDLPKLDIFSSEYVKTVGDLHQNTLDLNHVATQAQNSSKIFTSLSHKMLADLNENELLIQAASLSPFNWQTGLLIITTLLASIAFVGLIMVYRKFKLLSISCLLLQKASMNRVTASPSKQLILDYFQHQPSTTTPEPFFKLEIPEITVSKEIDAVNVIAIILCIIFVLYVCFRIYRWLYPTFKFQVIMEIGTQDSRVAIKLQSYPHSVDCYTYSASRFLSNITTSGILFPKLKITWP